MAVMLKQASPPQAQMNMRRLAGALKKGQRGFTLMEAVVSLTILGLVVTPMASLFYGFLALPMQQTGQLAVSHGLRQLAQWLTEDARMAQTVIIGTSPDYVTIAWADYTVSPSVSYSARYYWNNGAVMRQINVGSESSLSQVAGNIQQYSDITFQISGNEIAVRATASISPLTGVLSGDADIRVKSRASALVVVRPAAQYAVWPFEVPSDYSYDSNKIVIASGEAQLKAVSPGVYPADDPTIQPIVATTVLFSSLAEFSERATKNGGEIKYIVSRDGGTTWYWWNGFTWQVSNETYALANTAAELNPQIASFPGGAFLFRAFLHSDGTQPVSLDQVTIAHLPP